MADGAASDAGTDGYVFYDGSATTSIGVDNLLLRSWDLGYQAGSAAATTTDWQAFATDGGVLATDVCSGGAVERQEFLIDYKLLLTWLTGTPDSNDYNVTITYTLGSQS